MEYDITERQPLSIATTEQVTEIFRAALAAAKAEILAEIRRSYDQVSAEEACRILCCDDDALRRLRRNRVIGYSKPGNCATAVYSRRELLALVDSGRVAAKNRKSNE